MSALTIRTISNESPLRKWQCFFQIFQLFTFSYAVSFHILRWCLNLEGIYVKGVRITWNFFFFKKGGIFEDNEPFVVPTLASILKLKKHGCLYIANES